MSDIHRLKTLDTLITKGVFVNDYPGLIMDGKDISFFFIRFTREEVAGTEPRRKKDDNGRFAPIFDIFSLYNDENRVTGTDAELKIFYLDDAGNCIFGRVEDEKRTVKLKTSKREAEAERVSQLILSRTYSAEGIDGVYQVKHSETKNVYGALGKFIAIYMLGWIGLFRQYETVRERTEIFRRFKPFKFPIFGTKETLKKAAFQAQLSAKLPSGDEDFKRIMTSYGDITLEDALSV